MKNKVEQLSAQEGSPAGSAKTLAALQERLALEGEDLEARTALGLMLCGLQRPQEASVHLRVVAEAMPTHAKSWVRLARALEQSGDRSSASAAGTQVTAIKPNHDEALERLAELPVAPDPRENALADMHLESSLRLARSLDLAGDLNEAAKAWARVLKLQGDNREARGRFAMLLVGLGRHKEAARHLQLLSNAEPEDLELALLWARCLEASGKLTGAREAWLRVVQCDATLGEAHERLSQLAEKPADAVPHLQALANADPNAPGPWLRLARGLAAAGDFPRALETWRRVVSLDPDDFLARERLGELLFTQGRREEGVAQLRSAPAVASLLASLSRDQSGAQDDAELIEQSRRLAPTRYAGGWVVEGLARRLASEGRFDDAMAALVEAPSDGQAAALEQAVLGLCAAVAGGPAATTRLSGAPVVLISQIQRSGGALLVQLFDGHPQLLVYPHELRLGRPVKWNWPKLNFDTRPRAWLTDMFDHAIARMIVVSRAMADGDADNQARRHRFRFEMRTFYDTFMLLARSATTQRGALDAYLTAFFAAWKDSTSLDHARWTVGYCPRLVLHADSVARFFADYPDGRMITCVRDPASWFAASKGRGAEYASIDTALALWCDSVGASLDLAEARPDQVHLVSYESLTADTAGEMQRLAAELGIAYDAGLTRPTFAGRPLVTKSPDAAPEPAADPGPLLSADELARIEQEAMPLYRRALELIAGRTTAADTRR